MKINWITILLWIKLSEEELILEEYHRKSGKVFCNWFPLICYGRNLFTFFFVNFNRFIHNKIVIQFIFIFFTKLWHYRTTFSFILFYFILFYSIFFCLSSLILSRYERNFQRIFCTQGRRNYSATFQRFIAFVYKVRE